MSRAVGPYLGPPNLVGGIHAGRGHVERGLGHAVGLGGDAVGGIARVETGVDGAQRRRDVDDAGVGRLLQQRHQGLGEDEVGDRVGVHGVEDLGAAVGKVAHDDAGIVDEHVDDGILGGELVYGQADALVVGNVYLEEAEGARVRLGMQLLQRPRASLVVAAAHDDVVLGGGHEGGRHVVADARVGTWRESCRQRPAAPGWRDCSCCWGGGRKYCTYR